MLKPYLAVLNAYWSSWTMRIMGALLVLFLALALIRQDLQHINPWPMIPVLLVASLFALSFAALTKEQFATPRALLVPDFNKRHLLVAGLVGGSFWVITTAVLAGVTAVGFIGTASVLLAFYAMIAWGTCLQPVILLVLVGLIYGFCCTAKGQILITAVMCGQVSLPSAALFAAGAGSLVFVAWKLSRLTEEQPEYALRFTAPSSKGELTASQREAIARSWFVLFQGRRLESLLARPVTGIWASSRRLQAARGAPSTALIAVAVLAGSWIVTRLLDREAPLSPVLACVALMGVLASWRFASRAICQEVVRPITRGQLLQQVGLVLLTDVFVFWLTVAALSAAVWAVSSPKLLTDSHAWYGLGIVFCGIPLFVGLSGLVLRIRSDLGFWTAGMVLYMAIVMSLVISMSEGAARSLNIWLPAGLLIAGLCACFGAYRVWLAGDLD